MLSMCKILTKINKLTQIFNKKHTAIKLKKELLYL